jgi:murein DD-endopeptidase MepM/ murein hydrolase activator NlpD
MYWQVVSVAALASFLVGAASAQEIEIFREKKPAAPKSEIAAPKQAPLRMEKAPTTGAAIIQTKKPVLAKSEVIPLTSVGAKPAPKADALAKGASKPVEDRPSAFAKATAGKSEARVEQAKYEGATAFIKLADGFDFPVGKPDGKGYYKARGFRSRGHLGEDWDGLGGGDTDLGDPIYCIGDGVVVFARDCRMGWGNVIIVRHVFRDGSSIRNIDSLYGHLQKILVHRGQAVKRGQQIATLGNANGLYDAHLHLEIRKNIEIGMSRAAFTRDFNNYCDPSQFIASHRVLPRSYGSFRVAMDTFRNDDKIRWDKVRRYSGHRGGSGTESAVALKKALASQGAGMQ